jgi:hypothetical protein
MLYLLDASMLITANHLYYPVNQVPEFWEWLIYMGQSERIKMPIEIFEEIKDSPSAPDSDLLFQWAKDASVKDALVLKEDANPTMVQRAVDQGYASDLNDAEIGQLGRDPFLVSYAIGNKSRCIVTSEISKPKRLRQNRHLPDVCATFDIGCHTPFELNKFLSFKTNWKTQPRAVSPVLTAAAVKT